MSDVICDIIAGTLEAEVVWRDDLVIAFLDHRPVFKGHVLLAPVTHVPTFTDAPADLVAPLFLQTQRVARAMVEALGADGSFTAVNTVISQSVPHLHVHVVPRRRKDGLRASSGRGRGTPRVRRPSMRSGCGPNWARGMPVEPVADAPPRDQANSTRIRSATEATISTMPICIGVRFARGIHHVLATSASAQTIQGHAIQPRVAAATTRAAKARGTPTIWSPSVDRCAPGSAP
ncbi:HIT family protein [Tessaracoccus coleopterorum]|uniref:HIT family protein n=1 Tax=Tessaracoccus coleopterorum TaxID=2714950 RepID=UPI002F90CCB9